MKILSYNVNGIRAAVKKDFMGQMETIDADIICLQETKAQDDQVAEALEMFHGYHIYSNSAVKKGYSGVAILSKNEPISIKPDIGKEEHDQEGRVLTAEYDDFYLVTVYVPNSGQKQVRLEYRASWDKDFRAFLKKLQKKKPIIVCGDLNVAHQAIDLARPKSNYNKTSGYTQQEIDGMSAHLGIGVVDSFRHFYPEKIDAYSWWSYRFGAKEKNIGWRLDYFLVSEPFISKIKDSYILPKVEGSDHCPVGIDFV